MLHRSLLSTCLLFTSALFLTVSCSNPGANKPTGESATSPNPAAASAPASESKTDVRLGFSAWPGWFPWQVAQEQKIFEANKASVNLKWFDGYLDSISALNAGQLDANSQTLGDTIASIAGGADQVVVLTNDNSTGNDKVIVNKNIKSVADLKGKKVAAEEGTVDHFLLLQGLKKAGMTAKDIKFVPLETGKAAAAFAAGQVDAVAVFAPFTTQALKLPGSRELFSSKDFPGSISDHLVVTRKFINEHPEKVQAMVDSWFATLDYIKANPDAANKILVKRAGVSDSEYQAYAQGTKIFTVSENLKAFQAGNDMNSLPYAATQMSAFLSEVGLAKTKPDLTKIFDDRFVKAYAAKAKK
ncbi:ABC transporter substrate-binding protein [Chamaesiphon sp. OTE_8_metabat_110]|uniref:ABC transporter substrate-binding protein n=1 Tax=Chamaesiphon sp. OTE_8_metabat_110 TaxID=2964696 RepID=UPI00286A95A0|nr:ABC transporter substrate-binding protein [Chamaesiphon sp. OTE_8_metabat_110]